MTKPKTNEVWITKNQRLVLIVTTHPKDHDVAHKLTEDLPNEELQMLWLDNISGEFTVSPLMDRLANKVDMNSLEWLEMTRCISCARMLLGISSSAK